MPSDFLRNSLTAFRDFIYPPLCLSCNFRLSADEDRVCRRCWDSLVRVDRAHPTWVEIAGRFEGCGLIGDMVSCYLLEEGGTLESLIHQLKYGGMKSLGRRLGAEIGRRIMENGAIRRSDILIPVPLHRMKRRERGFNQSDYLARGIAGVTGIPVNISLLVRTKPTATQTRLSIAARHDNVAGAFSVGRGSDAVVCGKTIILVDDVITTGSTINACAEQLIGRGVERVFAASVALAR